MMKDSKLRFLTAVIDELMCELYLQQYRNDSSGKQ